MERMRVEAGEAIKVDKETAAVAMVGKRLIVLIFIGPRYTWGPIYGSKSL